MLPFRQEERSGILLREFSKDVSSEELVWHMDKRDREVKILEGSGWKLQMDNDIPRDLIIGEIYKIPKYTYHRVWKGDSNLLVEIKEK